MPLISHQVVLPIQLTHLDALGIQHRRVHTLYMCVCGGGGPQVRGQVSGGHKHTGERGCRGEGGGTMRIEEACAVVHQPDS